MNELISEEQAVRVITFVAWVTLPLGLAAGWLYGLRHKADRKLYLAYGGLIGLSGPFIYLMWRLYNTLVNHYGLASVKGLLIELLVFVLIGLALGFILAQLVVYLKHVLTGRAKTGRAKRTVRQARARGKKARRKTSKKKAARRKRK